jgi:acyl carrier protein
MTSTGDRLRTIIATDINPAVSEADLTDDLPLFEQQIIDSLGIFSLVSAIESEFGVEIVDEELLPENFGSIGAMAKFIDAKSGTA